MSIQATLQSLQGADILFADDPARTRQGRKRGLFHTRRAWEDLHDPQSATNLLRGRGKIEAALTYWVTGGWIYGDRTTRFLRDLCPPPPEVWEVRVRDPSVQVRLLGRFAELNTLILTAFHTRGHLAGKGSKVWTDAMEDCIQQWGAFSPALPVFSAESIHQYVTENCSDFPIKEYRAGDAGPRKTRSRGVRRR